MRGLAEGRSAGKVLVRAVTGPAFAKPPRLNHVAMSVPADALDAEGRAALFAFYGDVFGFEEYEDLTEDRHRLVFRAHHHEQFMFLISEDEPMRAPRLDHFGMSVVDRSTTSRRSTAAPRRGRTRSPTHVDLIEPQVEEYVGDAQPPQLLRPLPPPPHGRDPALRVPALRMTPLRAAGGLVPRRVRLPQTVDGQPRGSVRGWLTPAMRGGRCDGASGATAPPRR